MTVFPLRRWVKAAAMTTAAALVLTACAGSGSSGDPGPQTLKFAYFSGENTSFGRLWSWWMDEVETRSGGSITFERFWDASLLQGPEMVGGLRDGRVDVAQVVPPMYPGKFPLTSVTELPFVSDNVPAGAAAITQLAQENEAVREEWSGQGLTPLAWNIAAPGSLGTTEPLAGADDLSGRSIRGIDRSSKVLGAAGANLVNLDLNEVYTGMERGLINGFFGIPFAFVGPLKFQEIAKHYTDVGMGITTANALAMSEKGWDSLTPEQQQVMIAVSAEAPAKLAEFDGATEDATCEAVRAAGATVTRFPQAEIDALRAAGEEQVRAEWVGEVAGSGVDGGVFYEEWKAAVAAGEAEYADYELGMTRCTNGTAGNR